MSLVAVAGNLEKKKKNSMIMEYFTRPFSKNAGVRYLNVDLCTDC